MSLELVTLPHATVSYIGTEINRHLLISVKHNDTLTLWVWTCGGSTVIIHARDYFENYEGESTFGIVYFLSYVCDIYIAQIPGLDY